MRETIIVLLSSLAVQSIIAQQFELEGCIAQVELNYPLLKQKNIEKEINTISNKLNATSWLPQISLNGQASYQSDVTSIDIPGFSIETLDKDQYKAYADIRQTLYDGGITKLKRDLQNLNSQMNDVMVDIEMHNNVIQQAQKYFFNALIAQENIKILVSSKEDINARIKVQETGVEYGTVKQSQVDILKVELLKIDQKIVETKTVKKASLDVVSLLAGMLISEKVTLITPIEYFSDTIDFDERLEFTSYKLQKSALDKSTKLVNADIIPKANLFGQAGYGRPGFNLLSNDFDTYYIVGARISWDFSGLYRYRKNKKLNELSKNSIDVQKDVFETNLETQRTTLEEEINKLEEMIEMDKNILVLRQRILKVAGVELDNGISTATDYLIEKNAETQAQQALSVHQIQKIATAYEIKLLTGN